MACIAVTQFLSFTGRTEDTVQTQMVFADDVSNAVNVVAAIKDFWNDAQDTGLSVGSLLGDALLAGAGNSLTKVYELVDFTGAAPLGPPSYEEVWQRFDLTGGVGSMPNEVCACLDFHSDWGSSPEFLGSARPRQRHRNRIYIGPLKTTTRAVADHQVYVRQDYRETIGQAAQILALSEDVLWSTWSRVNASVDYPVIGCFISNAPAIQRRRGVRESDRTVVSFV